MTTSEMHFPGCSNDMLASCCHWCLVLISIHISPSKIYRSSLRIPKSIVVVSDVEYPRHLNSTCPMLTLKIQTCACCLGAKIEASDYLFPCPYTGLPSIILSKLCISLLIGLALAGIASFHARDTLFSFSSSFSFSFSIPFAQPPLFDVVSTFSAIL